MEPASEGRDWNTSAMKETVPDEKQRMQWIANRPLPDQEQATKEHFQELLKSASQPRYASGNACVKLCYFLEQCRKSTSKILREVAFSHETCLDLFNFYVEWNEKNQHRSMRQVLELLASMITLNPDQRASSIIQKELLERLLAIITHQSARPLVKPSLKVLECLLVKDAISVRDLTEVYGSSAFTESRTRFQRHFQKVEDPNLWHSFIYAVFEWMSLPDTSPAAGKLLVTLFQKLKAISGESPSPDNEIYTILWQQWIRHGVMRHPDSLENIKNYLLQPLFKLDKIGSLKFLQDLAPESNIIDLNTRESDALVLLLLSAIEAGKKFGLVNEPNMLLNKATSKPRNSVILPEYSIGGLLSHKAGNIRSTAFSVLISSISSIRPFPSKTFDLLKQNLWLLHSDTDARIRNEVLSTTKHMVERLKGAVSFLTQEVASNHTKHNRILEERSEFTDFSYTALQEKVALQEHNNFILWYKHFLMNELIPTASYQRHITSLRAIYIIVDSGILIPNERTLNHPVDEPPQKSRSGTIFTEKMVRLLLDMLMDPFEDVRAAATQLLKLAPEPCFRQQHDSESSPHLSSLIFSLISQNTSSNCNGNNLERTPSSIERRKTFKEAKIPKILASYIQKAEYASKRTGRADLADGVARIHELIYCLQATDEARLELLENLVYDLEMNVMIARKDLAQAVILAPVHGQFAALRLVCELFNQSCDVPRQGVNLTATRHETSSNELKERSAWIDLQYRMTECCIRIWAAVKEVLCNDSPEGHLPQDLDEFEALDTKDVLSYSFRAIHESSNLLRVMVSGFKLKFADDSAVTPFKIFQAAGNLSFEQLSNLRHRGAFSTVSLTFAKCCQLTQEGSEIEHPGVTLLGQWYQSALMCIYEQSTITRRSAGIPALMTGILSANSKSPALEDVMAQLKTLARQPAVYTAKDGTNLPQVHAMNCLKEIFKSSSLGKRCDSHIADCLKIASESLKSKIWAIRNCGLLLLRSLIDCLFGTSESKSVTEAGWDGKSIRLAYERYPALPEILLNLITTKRKEYVAHNSSQIGAVESVFPALDIIRRAGPPKKLRTEIQACIKFHLGSSFWHVRDIAARTICTLLLDSGWFKGLTDLLETCGNSTNQIHGVLLATKHLLERRLELNIITDLEDLEILIPRINDFWATKPRWTLNPMNEAAYVNVILVTMKIARLPGSKPIITHSDDALESFSALLQAGHFSSRNDEPVSIIQSTFNENTSTLLFRAVTIRAVNTAATTGQIDRLQKFITSLIRYDIDIACDALEQISVVWNIKESKAEHLEKLIHLYCEVYTATTSNTVQSVTLRNLADTLEHLLESSWLERSNLFSTKLYDFGLSLQRRGSPDLSNAEVRLTGSLLALDFHYHKRLESFKHISERIKAWGDMIRDNGNSENDFDTRYAALAALRAFYYSCSVKIFPSSETPFLVPSLLALYNTLSDDDDEIRDAGGEVVSRILGSHQAPLAASGKILDWLHQNFGETEAFRTEIMHRVANSNTQTTEKLEPAEQQLATAMLNDDSLFVEEDQNLYIDEVREANAWTSLLATAKSSLSDEETSRLSSWTLEGLYTLARLAEVEDGPFGWSSKPRVFAICMKVILAAKAIIARYDKDPGMESVDGSGQDGESKGKPLRDAVSCLLEVGRRNKFHSVLLDELAKSEFCSA